MHLYFFTRHLSKLKFWLLLSCTVSVAVFPVCCFICFLWLRWDWRITKCLYTSDVLINSSMCCDPFSQSQEHKHSASFALQRWLSCADVWRGSVIDVNHAGHSARAFHPDAHRWLATVTWIQPKGMLWVTLADGQSQSRISCLKAIFYAFPHLFTHSFSVSLPPFLRYPPSFCLSV